MADHPRIDELRRRVDSDPASIAFAQLAEEYRRAGAYDDAVRVCRSGLVQHPNYLSSRVTLGRALIELEQFDEAWTELQYVLHAAPDNLAAIRGLAEIHQRRGNLGEALKQFNAAHAIARDEPPPAPAAPDYSGALEAIDSLSLELTGPPPHDPVLEELEWWLDAILADRAIRESADAGSDHSA